MFRPCAATTIRLLTAASALALVAACGGSPAASPATSPVASPAASAGSPAASPGDASPSAEASAGAEPSASSAAGGGSTLALQGKDFSYVGPASAPAGVTTVTLENVGQELHQAQLVRINDGKTFDDFIAAIANPDPSAALGMVTLSGGPTAVTPGSTGESTQDLTAGSYAFLCFISGADGIPHVAKGMIAPLTVTGTASGGALPAGDATVVAKDFSFDVPAPVAAGEHTFTFTNDGPQPHEAGVVKLAPGTSVDQLKAIFTASPAPSGQEPQGPPPWEDFGGIGAISSGATATFTVTLEPGQQYAFICFVPDPATGKAHAELGMITAIPTQ